MLDQEVSQLGHVDTLGPLFTFRNGTIHLRWAMKKTRVIWGYMGDDILPSYVGIIP